MKPWFRTNKKDNLLQSIHTLKVCKFINLSCSSKIERVKRLIAKMLRLARGLLNNFYGFSTHCAASNLFILIVTSLENFQLNKFQQISFFFFMGYRRSSTCEKEHRILKKGWEPFTLI